MLHAGSAGLFNSHSLFTDYFWLARQSEVITITSADLSRLM